MARKSKKPRIIGLKKVQDEFKKYGERGLQALRYAIYKEANDIMLASIVVTPKDDNYLRNSWYATQPGKRGAFSELGYGAEYATHVHEMPNTVNWSEPGTGNKYLEKPFNVAKQGASERIARVARRELDHGGIITPPPSKIPKKPKTGKNSKKK